MSLETELIERIARLESRLEEAEKRHEKSLRQFEDDRNAQNKMLNELLLKFARYEGKWGGVVMVVSALAALFAMFKTEVFRRMFGG